MAVILEFARYINKNIYNKKIIIYICFKIKKVTKLLFLLTDSFPGQFKEFQILIYRNSLARSSLFLSLSSF